LSQMCFVSEKLIDDVWNRCKKRYEIPYQN